MDNSHTCSILLEYRSHHALPRLALKIYIRKYVYIYIHKGLVHVRDFSQDQDHVHNGYRK